MAISANSAGVVRGQFTIPSGIPSGAKEVIAVGAGGSRGQAVFAGQGTIERQLFQQQTSIQETRWQSPPPIETFMRGSDPLAETFMLTETTQISGVDLWFIGKPTSNTRVQIRDTIAGVPSQNVLAEVVLTPSQIVGNLGANEPPPVGGIVTKQFAVSGSGSLVVPSGVTTIKLTGNGSAGLSGVGAVAPTYSNWMFSVAQPTGVNNPVSSILVVDEIPNDVPSIPDTFTVHGVNNRWLGIAGGEAIFFELDFLFPPTLDGRVYKGVSAAGTIVLLFFGRNILTSGTTGVSATAGANATAVIGVTTKTFAGASSGVTTSPAPSLQTHTVSGSVPTLVLYNVPDGGSLLVEYNEAYTSDTDDGQAAGGLGATRALFPFPRTLIAGVEYAIVILCSDATGSLAIAELGKFDTNAQRWITSQPYTIGVLLSSSNASTWTAHQDRDLTFALLKAEYTETSHTYDLGTVSVADITDLLLMSYTERPTSETFVQYNLTLPDSSVVRVSDGQPVQLPAAITGNVAISAVMSGTDLSPVLHPGTQLVVGKVAASAIYVTRAIPAGTSVRIKVIFEGVIPSGATVTLAYRGIDPSDTWTTVPYVSDRAVDDGFNEFTHQVTGVTEQAVQVKVTLTGTSAARPRVRDLRVIVL